MGNGRTSQVKLSRGGLALKFLRERSELSMRSAASKLGYSSSYISHIENGRENPPEGEKLLRFLKAYSSNLKEFSKLQRKVSVEDSEEIIRALLPKLDRNKKKFVQKMIEQLVNS